MYKAISNCIDMLLDARRPANIFKPGEVTRTCPHCGYNLGAKAPASGDCPECNIYYDEPVNIPVRSLDATGKREIPGRGKVFQMPRSSKVLHIPKKETVMNNVEKAIDRMLESGPPPGTHNYFHSGGGLNPDFPITVDGAKQYVKYALDGASDDLEVIPDPSNQGVYLVLDNGAKEAHIVYMNNKPHDLETLDDYQDAYAKYSLDYDGSRESVDAVVAKLVEEAPTAKDFWVDYFSPSGTTGAIGGYSPEDKLGEEPGWGAVKDEVLADFQGAANVQRINGEFDTNGIRKITDVFGKIKAKYGIKDE